MLNRFQFRHLLKMFGRLKLEFFMSHKTSWGPRDGRAPYDAEQTGINLLPDISDFECPLVPNVCFTITYSLPQTVPISGVLVHGEAPNHVGLPVRYLVSVPPGRGWKGRLRRWYKGANM